MRSASRQAITELTARQQELLGRLQGSALIDAAGELFGVASLLVGQPRLRRTLADPATDAAGRAALAGRLFDGQVGERVLDVVQAAVVLRWSSPWDLCDAIEMAGDGALFAAAEADGILDEVEDQLFRFERILSSQSALASLLDEQSAPASARLRLLDAVVGAKVATITLELLRHSVSSERKRSLTLAIDNLLEQAAARRERSVARVISASALTEAQQTRLAEALRGIYGRAISIRAAIDPTVRGGLVIRVGDEVIDGSVAARLAEARAGLAG